MNSFFLLLFPSFTGHTQQAVSIDVAGLRNTSYNLSGLNVSCFYHFSKRITGGIELNRFFPTQQVKTNEEMQLSAWDADINFHYFIFPEHKWRVYAAAGVTHTSDKEVMIKDGECTYERFWSLYTGAGLLNKRGKWAPHVEYHFAWGLHNQQTLLAGFSYELEWGKEK